MNIVKIPIADVQPWEKNPRGIKTKDFDRLKKQITKLGVYKPLICYRENGHYVVLGGNMRIRALKELGIQEVEVSIIKPKTEAQKIEYALSDNDRVGYYEEEALAELVYPHIKDIDLGEFKVDLGEPIDLKQVVERYGPDIDDGADEIPEMDDTPAVTKTGDLFTLGKHRLLCGDSTKAEDVARLMRGEKADMVFTDPPYKLSSLQFGSMPGKKRQYGDLDSSKVPTFDSWLSLANGIMAEGARILIWEHNQNTGELWQAATKYFEVKGLIIWHATNRHNMFVNPGTGLFNIYDICLNARMRGGRRKLNRTRSSPPCDLISETVEREARSHQDKVFGAKPVEILTPFIERFTLENEIVVDFYTGSGSTLIATQKEGRQFRGMEIYAKYCDVIIKRYADYVGVSEDSIRATREKRPNSAPGGPGSNNRARMRPTPRGARKRAKNG